MASSAATTVDAYLDSLPSERRTVVSAARDMMRRRLPNGFEEGIQYGMIYYYIPLARYPETYNGHPLCYAGLAAQKNHYAIYLMGVYGDSASAKRFKDAFAKAGKKLDMGKSCVRFKTIEDISLDAIGDSIASMTPDDYIALYEKSRLQTKAGSRAVGKKPAGKVAKKNAAQ